ncbi:UNVERIFIED_CONTAM: protein NRT1/ PTR FAMILY 1.2 [Sesamum radiatum]|uniref:Protein NRT1/ PTR FAMILY 1.2 n=1 Tax=Sesamum radiatum TaxID=300843 RepID=A0AAW2R2R2_SESRA
MRDYEFYRTKSDICHSCANEAFEKIASYGLQPNMILYLITEYNFSAASGTSTLFIWGAISNFMPIFGAFLSDSYFGRFLVIAVATVTTLTVRLSSLSPRLRVACCETFMFIYH